MPTPLPTLRPAEKTRADQILDVVREALLEYRDMLNSSTELRSVVIDVKMRDDGRGARAAIITLQGEVKFIVRGS